MTLIFFLGQLKGESEGALWQKLENEARQIPVNDTLEDLFKNIRKRHGLTSKYAFLYDGQVYKTKTGKVKRPIKKVEAKPVKEVKSSFNSVLTRAGIVDFRFHDLRHTFASQLLLKGGNLKVD